MVKVKTQAKVAVKAKSKTATSAAAAGRPTDKVRMPRKKEAGDSVKKSPRGAAKTPSGKAAAEALEAKITAAAKSPDKAADVTEIAKAVMAVKEPGMLSVKLAKVKAVKEGKAQVKDSEKPLLAPQDIEARRMRLKNLIVER